MRRSTPKTIRNKLDLTDRAQMRLFKKRLGHADAKLTAIVERIGNSLSAISKEPRSSALLKSAEVPLAAMIASAATSEQATAELAAATPAS